MAGSVELGLRPPQVEVAAAAAVEGSVLYSASGSCCYGQSASLVKRACRFGCQWRQREEEGLETCCESGSLVIASSTE